MRTNLCRATSGVLVFFTMSICTLSAKQAVPFKPPEEIRFMRGPRPFKFEFYETHFDGLLRYSHLYESHKNGPVVHYRFTGGEIVALSGGVYRVSGKDSVTLYRIPDNKMPKTLKPVANDSFTIPLQRDGSTWAKVNGGQARVLGIKALTDGKIAATIQYVQEGLSVLSTTVKEGDTVLFGNAGFLVRNVVPYDKEECIAGWVEFAAQIVSEADLIRDKKALVRPERKNESK